MQNWFAEELPKLSPDVIEEVLRDLRSRDGEAPDREMMPVYPKRAPLPSLGASPQVVLAEDWKRMLARLFAQLRRR